MHARRVLHAVFITTVIGDRRAAHQAWWRPARSTPFLVTSPVRVTAHRHHMMERQRIWVVGTSGAGQSTTALLVEGLGMEAVADAVIQRYEERRAR